MGKLRDRVTGYREQKRMLLGYHVKQRYDVFKKKYVGWTDSTGINVLVLLWPKIKV